jgi:signal transduction histidine kinase
VVGVRGAAERERAERDRADLISTVAHELRSPLTSVKGFTATLLAKWDRFNDEQRQLMLRTVNADADRVTRLITELLDVSRIDADRLELHKQVVDVASAVARSVDGRVASGDLPERFEIVASPSLPEVWLDPDKLDQVLANLLDNAIRHGAGLVTVAVQPGSDHSVLLTVTDEGDGVPPDIRGQVFRRFWRAGRRGGTGLGLYIVKGLVEAHGGEVSVTASEAGGARFVISLPSGIPDFAR